MPFVNDQGKEALNFAITVSIICVALLMLTVLSLGIGALLTIPLMLAIGIASLVLAIMAAIKATEPEPMTLIEWWRKHGQDNGISAVVDYLSLSNRIFEDMVFYKVEPVESPEGILVRGSSRDFWKNDPTVRAICAMEADDG